MRSPSATPRTHVWPPLSELASRTGASISVSSSRVGPPGCPPSSARCAARASPRQHHYAILAAHGRKATRPSGLLVHKQPVVRPVPRALEARGDLVVEGLVGGQNHHRVGARDRRACRLRYSALVDGLHEGAVEAREVGKGAARVGEQAGLGLAAGAAGRLRRVRVFGQPQPRLDRRQVDGAQRPRVARQALHQAGGVVAAPAARQNGAEGERCEHAAHR